MKLCELALPGVYAFEAPPFIDERGSFTKLFHRPTFVGGGLNLHIAEVFTSQSKGGVVRGLHFQLPPYAHTKIVTCTFGAVSDVVVDLRRGTADYGRALRIELSASSGRTLIIPEGCAHGFVARTDNAIMFYATTREHQPSADAGILWSSVGIDWEVEQPIVSRRDSEFPPLDAFDSPF